jgi:hypothetical protein
VDPRWIGIALCAATSTAILLAEHYWLKRTLHPTLNYALGVLAIYLPLTALFLEWQDLWVLAALWIVTGVGGAVVVISHLLDGWSSASTRLQAAEREGKKLREVMHDAGKDQK